ncbi:hypothetical protein [Nocardia sp. NPDC004123]
MPDGVGTKVDILRAAEAYAPVVVVWPGIGARGAQYRQFASELRERGCTVVVGELHGQGESRPEPPRTSRYGMHAQVVNDYHRVAGVLTAIDFQRNGILEIIERMWREYGDISELRVADKRIVVLAHPEHAAP